ncbi:MAG: hypothetical protein MJ233_04800 [Mycoplasmoidaceae bacterium]|nr:hypothetical protein [Mycoplasmoidaceae bacterium]
MAILGVMLDKATTLFSRDMTLVPGKGGFVIPDQDSDLTILQWLDYNMYLMC